MLGVLGQQVFDFFFFPKALHIQARELHIKSGFEDGY
jgi:hypothetical protein